MRGVTGLDLVVRRMACQNGRALLAWRSLSIRRRSFQKSARLAADLIRGSFWRKGQGNSAHWGRKSLADRDLILPPTMVFDVI